MKTGAWRQGLVVFAVGALVAAAPGLTGPASAGEVSERPVPPTSVATALAQSAEPIHPDLPNFHKVDDHLFRGGQPAKGGIATLKALGVRTILNLRHEPELVKAEEIEAQAAGLQYFSVPMSGLARPADKQMAGLLRIIDDPQNWPVFVHCKRGADRTGVVVACYRISHHRWIADKAVQEADNLGMMWLEYGKRSFIRDFYQTRGNDEGVVAAAGTGAEQASARVSSDASRGAPEPVAENAAGGGVSEAASAEPAREGD